MSRIKSRLLTVEILVNGEWIAAPHNAKAARRYGYSSDQHVVGIVYMNADGTPKTNRYGDLVASEYRMPSRFYQETNHITGKVMSPLDYANNYYCRDMPEGCYWAVENLDGTYTAKGEFRWVAYRDPKWREREAARMVSGGDDAAEYAELPSEWNILTPIVDHFAHIASDGAMIAFTPDATKGELDIQTVMKPGRYLTKFYPDLDGDTVRALAIAIDKTFGVQFADTQDAMQWVYENGPRSCMAYRASNFSSFMHPVRVYAAGDLQVAYLKRGDKVSDRAVVWPEKKLYGRVYGGGDGKLETALKMLGYQHGSLVGARLLKVEDQKRGGFVMPYLDNDQYIAHDGDEYFRISDSGSIEASSTNGLIHAQEDRYCELSDEYFPDDDEWIYVNGHGNAHHSVADGDTVFFCEISREYYLGRSYDHVVTDRGLVVEQSTFDDHGGYFCNGEQEYIIPAWRRRSNPAIEMADTGETYSTDYVTENRDDFYFCEADGQWYDDRTAAPDYDEANDNEDADAVIAA